MKRLYSNSKIQISQKISHRQQDYYQLLKTRGNI